MSYTNKKELVERFTRESFSACISRAKIASGLSLEAFAATLGVSRKTLEDYMDKQALPRLDNFMFIANVLGADFLADVVNSACLGDKVSISGRIPKPANDVSEVEKV